MKWQFYSICSAGGRAANLLKRSSKLPYTSLLRSKTQVVAGAFLACFLAVCVAPSQTTGRARPGLPVGSLTSGREMTTARAGHTATVLPDFKVLIVGGRQAHGVILASTEVYDPTTET